MLKRAFDAVLAGLGLILSAPLSAIIAAAIRLEDGGPIFYCQERVGLGGRTFLAGPAAGRRAVTESRALAY